MGQRDDARIFAADWNGRGDEKSDYQNFWRALLSNVFYITEPEKFIKFEKRVSFDKRTHFIDAFIPSTRVLIEQKSFGESLSNPERQSDGERLTPFEQALRYAENMEFHERPRWIVTCNFSEFHIYYVQNFFLYIEISPPVIVKLEDLPDDYKRLKFLVDPDDTTILEDVNISKEALKIVGGVRDSFVKIYERQRLQTSYEFIYKFCVRLVFCFYADDAFLFHTQKYFADYLNKLRGGAQIDAIKNIFDVLNTPNNLRGNVDVALQNLPYVNGGLFAEKISFPDFKDYYTTPIDGALIANKNFHWEKINPTIFGSLFESALNPVERRQGGMHYTSPENIHKVIDPLFLEELGAELKSIKHHRTKNRRQKLIDFQDKLASLVFLDPACGSGNFLTETYTAIRALENEVIRELDKMDALFHDNPVKVSIKNFFGIEIDPFAVAIARLAMVISEHQMLHKTEKIIHQDLKFFPLDKEYHQNIICANALQTDWATLVTKDKLCYIIGNPPFVGTKYQSPAQKADIINLCKALKPLDYVTGWYYKASEFIQDTKIECAFVSTNSIAQGEQVAPLWKVLNVNINFAYRTFKWQSESESMAAVHCVIIGFAKKSRRKKFIYVGEEKIPAQNINGYLQDAPNIYIEKRKIPLQDFVPQIFMGSTMVDDDNFNFTKEQLKDFLKLEPAAKKFIHPLIGSEEFIKGKRRYCLWLKDVSIDEIKKFPKVYERVQAVKKFRETSNRNGTKKGAANPKNFLEIRQPETEYILIPKVSSENRKYIPIGFFDENFIAVNTALIIPNATIYYFGILSSVVHNAWMRAVGGRLEMRYQYSATIVYNNFIWCEPTEEQRQKIEGTAQKILDVLKQYTEYTLGELYDEKKMPDDLRAAHTANDRAVLNAYGFDLNITESEIVAALMNKYKAMIDRNGGGANNS